MLPGKQSFSFVMSTEMLCMLGDLIWTQTYLHCVVDTKIVQEIPAIHPEKMNVKSICFRSVVNPCRWFPSLSYLTQAALQGSHTAKQYMHNPFLLLLSTSKMYLGKNLFFFLKRYNHFTHAKRCFLKQNFKKSKLP